MKKSCLVALCLFLLTSCKKNITLAPLSDQEVADLQSNILNRTDSIGKKTNMLQFTSSSEDQENFWKTAFKSCYSSSEVRDNTLFNRQLLYLGPSNNEYVGAIFDNKGRLRNDLSFLSQKEFEKFTDIGVDVQNCNLSQVKKTSIDFLLGAGMLSTINADLSFALASADSIIVTGGKWRVDKFKIDRFEKYIDTCTLKDIADYKESLNKKNNKVITLIIKVDGFSAKAFLKSKITSGLEAQLKNKQTAKLDSAKLSLKFSPSTDRQIDISSTNSFYIFANVYKNSSLKE